MRACLSGWLSQSRPPHPFPLCPPTRLPLKELQNTPLLAQRPPALHQQPASRALAASQRRAQSVAASLPLAVAVSAQFNASRSKKQWVRPLTIQRTHMF